MISVLEEQLFERGVRNIRILTSAMNDGAIRTYEQAQYGAQEELVLCKTLMTEKP